MISRARLADAIRSNAVTEDDAERSYTRGAPSPKPISPVAL